MKIIDFHAHIYPDKIAKKASDNIGAFYNMEMRYKGDVSTLINLGDRFGIDQFVVQSVATSPNQVESINDFIARCIKKYPNRLIGFATLHPDYKNLEKEIERILSLGFKGVKLHPDFQEFNIDSKSAFQIYELLEGRLPILIHTGDSRTQYSKPNRLLPVLDQFPDLKIIAAHFGGWSEWEIATRKLIGRNIYVDTSSSLYAFTPEQAKDLIYLFGVDKVLFGSDYPMWSPGEEIAFMDKIDLTQEEREKIMYLNAERLLFH